MTNEIHLSDAFIESKIYNIRGLKVMIDRDLAEIYGVETRILNQTVKRNFKRFPIDFMFQMTEIELQNWKSQIVTSNKERMGIRKLPFLFTEQGVTMLSCVLNSDRAIEVNIRIVRTFTRLREMLVGNKDVLLKLEKLDKKIITIGHDVSMHDREIETLFELIKEIMETKNKPLLPKPVIGFKTSSQTK
jgi:hypothetical protein